MKLEQRVKELEKRLAIKKALLNVKLSFPKDTPQSVKKTVEEQLKQAAVTLAEDQEVVSEVVPSQFSSEELEILKLLAKQAMRKMSPSEPVSKKTPPNKKPETLNEIIKANKKLEKPMKAKLLTLDSVEPQVRKRVEPEAIVKVVSMSSTDATVSWQGPPANKHLPGPIHNFKIPLEDLELINEKEQ